MNYLVGFLGESWPLLLQGVVMTMKLWIIASFVSLVLGVVLGIVRSNSFRITYISVIADVVTFIFRGIPFYVQLLMAYFVLPTLIGITISAFTAACISLGLCSAGYVSQIVRSGVNAIEKGQWEAAQVLGYSRINTIRYIIIPQMLSIVLPSLVGESDQLIKSTSVVSAIGILELTGAARNIIAYEMNPLTIYTTLAVIYLSISSLLALCSRLLERKLTL